MANVLNLAELINSVKKRDHMSGRELVERARRKGAPPPTPLVNLSNPVRKLHDFPHIKTIIGLSAALEEPPDVIVAAVLESLGLAPQDVVEIHVQSVTVHTDSDFGRVRRNPDEAPRRWLVIIPEQDTPDDVIEGLKTGSRKLRLSAEVTAPTGETASPQPPRGRDDS